MSAAAKKDDVYQEELDEAGITDSGGAVAEAHDGKEGQGEGKAAAPAKERDGSEEPAWLRVKNMANALLKAGYPKEASSAYKEALDIAPSEAEKAILQANLALAYLKLMEPRQAVAYCEGALAVLEKGGFDEPPVKKEKLLLRKAAALEMWGRHKEAAEAAEEVLKREPANAEARTILAKCKAVLGPQESDKALKKAMAKALSTDGGLYSEKLDAEAIRQKKLEDAFSKRVTEMYDESIKEEAEARAKAGAEADFIGRLFGSAFDGLKGCFQGIAARLCPTGRGERGAGDASKKE